MFGLIKRDKRTSVMSTLQKVNCCFNEKFCYLSCMIVQYSRPQASYQNKNTIVTPVGGIVRLGLNTCVSIELVKINGFTIHGNMHMTSTIDLI